MSAFERLLAIADEETLDLARAMIGKPELALLLVKEALKNTTEVLSPTTAAKVRNMTPRGASDKMIFTLILKNERRDLLLYLRVITVFKLLRLVGQALEMRPRTHIEISEG